MSQPQKCMDMEFICPQCRQTLHVREHGQIFCPSCDRLFKSEDGVLRMLDTDDGFYEGTYLNNVKFVPASESLRHAWPLWLINSGYVWTARKHVAAGATVIELGCAGGVDYFGERFRMIGADLSHASLKILKRYAYRVQLDAAACIPFPDGSIDAVFSSFFWEHIHPDIKPKMLAEIRRVLRPGGRMVFLYDVETRNPLIARFKRREPALYDRLFLEGDGHIGYQTPAENIRLFTEAGFDVIRHKGLEKTCIQHGSVYSKLAQFRSPLSGLLGALSKPLGGILFRPYTLLMRTIDTVICPLLPDDWARIDLVVLGKPQADRKEGA